MADTGFVDVDFDIERDYIYSALVADISVTDAILDLIDNSIDAARKNLQSKSVAAGVNHLPTSYSGYSIDLTVDQHGITVEDNCHGLEEDLLTKRAFKLGARHEQNFSIGMYGVGLVRAFWKLGNSLEMVSDNGDALYSLQVDRSDVLRSEKPVVPARKVASKGKPANTICINDLHPSTVKDVSNSHWREQFFKQVSKTFGLCIAKGLAITINNVPVPQFGPKIRRDIKHLMAGQTFSTDEGVSIKIEVGVHQDYRYSGEPGHNARKNAKFTKEFGWYVVCNDRMVLTAARTPAVGWTSEWHSEYNGFLGWVYLESADAKRLPWNSKKTDLILDHEVQRVLAASLRAFSDGFRSVNSKFRYDRDVEPTDQKPTTGSPSPQPPRPTVPATPKPPQGGGTGSKPGTPRGSKPKRPDHSKDNYSLLLPCHISTKNRRVRDLVHEAQSLLIYEFPYAGALLLRSCAETVVVDYLVRKRLYQRHLSEHWGLIDNARASEIPPRPPMDAKQKNDKIPTFRETLTWLSNNPEAFEDQDRRLAMRSLQHFMKDLQVLNGLTHENGTISDSEQIRSFRNRVFPLIEIMLK
ncbi:ATP-binding protein [Pseudokordiimonas caeni]|uniref:ATP-binding protein n=1 Tax=Pseudokordiimonas caeni TaxID=2997908 RepID=UPI00281234E6|nr:ATP-binding protein [Pseudokordiimonas caeni]